MRTGMFPDLEYRLAELEHMLARQGRARTTAAPEVRQALHFLHHELFRSRAPWIDKVSHGNLHKSFHMLMHRADKARTTEDLREILRDTRQYMLAISSMAQAQEMEARLHDLEGRVRTVAETAAQDGHPIDGEVVTLESLESKRVLFVIMPFSDAFSDVWLGGIKRAAAGTGLTPIRIDSITKTSEITDDIVKAIQLAEVVVVDVTGNNPNVMFEFGFALALKKPHVVISQSTDYLTFDIKNLRSLIYRNTWQGIEHLHKDLQNYIKGAAQARPKSAPKRAKAAASKGKTQNNTSV